MQKKNSRKGTVSKNLEFDADFKSGEKVGKMFTTK
jgi:hypothetical protein